MMPDTTHLVYTATHTICGGGHHFASCTMQHTMLGMMHTFILDDFISNTNHPPTRMLLSRMATFYYHGLVLNKYNEDEDSYAHLPDLQSFSSALDLIAFCNLIIFINVLNFKTYQYPSSPSNIDIDDLESLSHERLASIKAFDFNAISPVDRQRYQHARGLAYALIDWLFKAVDIIEIATGEILEDPYSSLWVPYISQQASALLNYKRLAEKKKLKGAPGCTALWLKRQILLCFEGTDLEASVNDAIEAKHSILAFPSPEKYTTHRREFLQSDLGEF
ncbi:hypothetical protein GALMADRAFT_76417 [Galerina marginata CBS 339.88]|uniref:Uncharacterized protein n=1 Tax=Galerina marginata (strain CBS 339.88) TaxID=685588 RepID=A0A067SRH7_GALM3|nr:hypothetical protein GALMADRAFT_76417 [Galerina marginata CBS 339.88]